MKSKWSVFIWNSIDKTENYNKLMKTLINSLKQLKVVKLVKTL